MKYLLPLTLILLVLSVLLNFRQCSSAKDEAENMLARNEQFQRDIERNRATAESARQKGDSLQKVHTNDSVLFESRKSALMAQIRVHKKTIATMRPEVTTQLDSLPFVKAFVELQDSTIIKQDSVITDLAGHLYDVGKSFTAQLELKDLQLQATNQTSDLWREAAENAENQTRKEKRKTKFWKIASGVITLGAIFLIAK